MSKDKNEIIEVKDYSVMEMDSEVLTQVIEENIGQTGIDRFDLDKAKVPTGGQTIWSIPTLEGEINTKELMGVIVYWKEVRAYWATEYDGSNNPPDCYSDDNVTGKGDPGGFCDDCPFAEFGSAEGDSQGQACKQMRILFVLRENDILPLAMPAPPTSVGSIKKYFLRLASKGIPYYGVITGFELEQTKNDSGVKYSVIKPKFKKRISKETIDEIKEYQNSLKPMLEKIQIDDSDYNTDDDSASENEAE